MAFFGPLFQVQMMIITGQNVTRLNGNFGGAGIGNSVTLTAVV